MAEEIKEEIKEEISTEETAVETEDVAETTQPVEETVAETATEPEYPEIKIELADGTEINVKVNGDNFVYEEDIKRYLTPANLIGIKFNGVEMPPMKLAGYREYPNGFHFVLIEKKQSEIEIEKLNAKLEYVAIMTDVEVE